MNKKKSKIAVIIICLFVFIGMVSIILGILYSSTSSNKKDDKPNVNKYPTVEDKALDENQKKVQKLSSEFNKYLVDATKTANDYYELTGIEPKFFSPMVGKDSTQEQEIPSEYKKKIKDDLTEYDKALEKYSKKLSDTIKEHYKFELVETPLYTENKKQLMQKVKIRPFSYIMYRNDLQEVMQNLLTMANINVEKESAESIKSIYMARVKAMEILQTNIDEYKNTKEEETNLIFDIGKKIKCSNCQFYINNAQGFYLDEVKAYATYNNYEQNKSARISKIIDNAVSQKVLDKSNPLSLKK